jgi:hypothetical protein
MDNIIFRERPNEHNECDQWTLVKDTHDDEAYVVQEHVVLDAILSGKPLPAPDQAHDCKRVFAD